MTGARRPYGLAPAAPPETPPWGDRALPREKRTPACCRPHTGREEVSHEQAREHSARWDRRAPSKPRGGGEGCGVHARREPAPLTYCAPPRGVCPAAPTENRVPPAPALGPQQGLRPQRWPPACAGKGEGRSHASFLGESSRATPLTGHTESESESSGSRPLAWAEAPSPQGAGTSKSCGSCAESASRAAAAARSLGEGGADGEQRTGGSGGGGAGGRPRPCREVLGQEGSQEGSPRRIGAAPTRSTKQVRATFQPSFLFSQRRGCPHRPAGALLAWPHSQSPGLRTPVILDTRRSRLLSLGPASPVAPCPAEGWRVGLETGSRGLCALRPRGGPHSSREDGPVAASPQEKWRLGLQPQTAAQRTFRVCSQGPAAGLLLLSGSLPAGPQPPPRAGQPHY